MGIGYISVNGRLVGMCKLVAIAYVPCKPLLVPAKVERIVHQAIVGMVFGNKEWEMDGKSGWFTNPDHMLTIEEIREGKFKVPADKPLKKDDTNTTTASSSVPEGFDELDSAPVPF